ncbi:MAG: ribose-5-phosphate isomerase RpiA [Nevskiaceae bacterium]|jgi:ribose 5-phosphate isomerase A|nr:ribose-5-phosphate isomerase RpiA [Nevskiaceae bacterium]
MDQQQKKLRVAAAAMEFLSDGMVLGVGTGSTVNALLDHIGQPENNWAKRLHGAVSSSEQSTRRLRELGVPLIDLNDIDQLDLYIDGADEANDRLELVKGGGGALTREKIIAATATRFVCIIDESKLVPRLGAFPLPVEVIPMARHQVAQRIAQWGGHPVHRAGFVTDNGNHILDVHGLAIDEPAELEGELNQIAGVVTVGLFARRPADLMLVGTDSGVRRLQRLA